MSGYKGKIEGIIETIYKQSNYILDNEVKQVLLDDSQHKLLSAPAGGTKTTLTQLMVALEKLDFMVKGSIENKNARTAQDRVPTVIPQDRILCLVYNRHNASDIDTVHAKFYNMLSHLKYISPSPAMRNYTAPGVYATTLHSYADKIIKENLGTLKMREFNLTREDIISSQFRSTVEGVMKKSSLEINNNHIHEAKGLYDLYVGLKLYETPVDKPLTDSVQFELALQNTQLPSKYLREIFERYDKRKKMLRLNEFSDMLRHADTILKVPELREHYSNYFSIIVADEVQDFTPLMFSIYSSLIGPRTKTVTVGDGDQAIYSFLGAMSSALENFDEIMNLEPERFDLSVNRRCRKDTMPFALNVIDSIASRNKREIKTNKLGGVLERVVFKNEREQIDAIERIMKENTSGNMGILFRNKDQSIILSRYLYTRGIQANFINAHNCMEHRIYTLFIETLNECFLTKTQKGLRMLNRILPFSRKDLEEFFKFDEKTGISETCPTAQFWGTLDFTPLYKNSKRYFSIHKQVEFIKQVARDSSTITASDCVPEMLNMFYKNYFQYLTETKEDPFAELILQWAKDDLAVGYNLRTAIDNLQKNIYKYMGRGRRVGKINICTIHGTKGLEFNHVILNLEKEQKPVTSVLSPQAMQFKEDEEKRLIYVAATRQIDSLHVLCSEKNLHPLADEKYFKSEESEPLEAKFSQEAPAILQDTTRERTRPLRGRRSLLLED